MDVFEHPAPLLKPSDLQKLIFHVAKDDVLQHERQALILLFATFYYRLCRVNIVKRYFLLF